jgi:lipoyl-dependent peroxiredoxin
LYIPAARAIGGRTGHVRSDMGILDQQVRPPKAMSGENDDFANPVQLFAAKHVACFVSGFNLVTRQNRIKTGETTVIANLIKAKTKSVVLT